jgi:hypothetical protein
MERIKDMLANGEMIARNRDVGGDLKVAATPLPERTNGWVGLL